MLSEREQAQRQQEDTREKRYYITTAIDYPNAPPHIGHSLEKVAADVVARFHRLQGHDTYFSMGLDENSQHVARAAAANGTDPTTWVNRMDRAFRLAWSRLDISYDYWIRTTQARHFRASQELFRRAQARGDIYKSIYAGWYCPNCNTFYSDEELVDGKCPNHPSLVPEWLEEENYFFALSKYRDRLLAHISEHPEFIVPAAWRAEVLATLQRGLRDFSVSRLVRPGTEAWGVPVPGNPQHVIYVWFDALTNYLTAVGFPDDEQQGIPHEGIIERRLASHDKSGSYATACSASYPTINRGSTGDYWPADAHVIGKDITRFHCLYWPAMLLSAGLPLPRQVAVHSFITLNGQRISKTAGNSIDPLGLVDEFGADAVRYSLVRNLSFVSDGDFTRANLLRHYNDELANDLGNLLNRVVTMIQRYRGGIIPTPGPAGALEEELHHLAEETRQHAAAALDAWDIGVALGVIWAFVRRTNQYIEQSEPWRLARQPENGERLDTVLYATAESLRLLSIFLAPYIPSACDRIRSQLGLGPVGEGAWVREGTWGSGRRQDGGKLTSLHAPTARVSAGPLLFPRILGGVVP